MTKEDYAAVRDRFLAALKSLREVQTEFVDTAFDVWDTEDDFDVPRILDDNGMWLSAREYYQVEDAVRLLEALVGRSAERASD